MDQSTSTSDARRLDAAIRRLEEALSKAGGGDADLRRRHDALTVQAQAALDGLDRILASAGDA